MQTTSSSVSTTSERMALLLEHIAEDPDAPLLTHTQNMLAQIGMMTATWCVQRFDCIHYTLL